MTPPRSVMLLAGSEASISLVSRMQRSDPSEFHAQWGSACMNAVRGAGWIPRSITRRTWVANPSASRPLFGMMIISSLDEAGSVEYTCKHTPSGRLDVHEMFSLYLTRTRSSQHPLPVGMTEKKFGVVANMSNLVHSAEIVHAQLSHSSFRDNQWGAHRAGFNSATVGCHTRSGHPPNSSGWAGPYHKLAPIVLALIMHIS